MIEPSVVRITFAVGSAAVAAAVALSLFSPLGRPVPSVVGWIPLGTLIVLVLGASRLVV